MCAWLKNTRGKKGKRRTWHGRRICSRNSQYYLYCRAGVGEKKDLSWRSFNVQPIVSGKSRRHLTPVVNASVNKYHYKPTILTVKDAATIFGAPYTLTIIVVSTENLQLCWLLIQYHTCGGFPRSKYSKPSSSWVQFNRESRDLYNLIPSCADVLVFVNYIWLFGEIYDMIEQFMVCVM